MYENFTDDRSRGTPRHVVTSTRNLEDNCCAVDNETCARRIARMYADLYLMEA